MAVSIPQSGLQAFRPEWRCYRDVDNMCVSIPQSGLQAFRPAPLMRLPPQPRCFNPSIGLTSVPTTQSMTCSGNKTWFQSLNRAYKRSDMVPHPLGNVELNGFNPSIGLTSVPTIQDNFQSWMSWRFNPSIGLTSVPTSL